jgi:hypothetical protein
LINNEGDEPIHNGGVAMKEMNIDSSGLGKEKFFSKPALYMPLRVGRNGGGLNRSHIHGTSHIRDT